MMHSLDRRQLGISLACAVVMLAGGVLAQTPHKDTRRIGLMMAVSANDTEGQARVDAFRQGLQEAGRADVSIDISWYDGSFQGTPEIELDVHDRIGGGDGFASGLIYGFLRGEGAGAALKLGWAHGALLTTYPGDITMARLEQVRALAQGAGARVVR